MTFGVKPVGIRDHGKRVNRALLTDRKQPGLSDRVISQGLAFTTKGPPHPTGAFDKYGKSGG